MAGDLKSSRNRAGVKHYSDGDENHIEYACYQEVSCESFDYHAPVSVKATSNGIKIPKPLRSSYSAPRCSKGLTTSKSRMSCSSSRRAYLGMEELQYIKRELLVIKNQIDDLLINLEHMDTWNRGLPDEK